MDSTIYSCSKDRSPYLKILLYLSVYLHARTPYTWYLSCGLTCMTGLNLSVLYGRTPFTNTFFSIPKYPYFAHGLSQAQWTSFRAISLLSFFCSRFLIIIYLCILSSSNYTEISRLLVCVRKKLWKTVLKSIKNKSIKKERGIPVSRMPFDCCREKKEYVYCSLSRYMEPK